MAPRSSPTRQRHLSLCERNTFISPYVDQILYIQTPCLAIRRETVNAWERRAPLAPKHVKSLIEKGIKVLVQPFDNRAYSHEEYVKAGAIIREDLSEAQLVMSVKQVKIEDLLHNKTYAFFSHTIKGQTENMPMLDVILKRKIRLIDYERICDSDGKRLVMFGKWAGYAGFLDILHGLGKRLKILGHNNNPFEKIFMAHNYFDSKEAIEALNECGKEILNGCLPNEHGPIIFVFTGTGNVSQGARELFKHLPHEYVEPDKLSEIVKNGNMNKIYGCIISRKHHLARKTVVFKGK